METGAPEALVESLANAARGPDRRGAAREIATLIRTHRGYRWVGVYDVVDEEIHALGWSGPNAPAHPRFPRNDGLCGRAVQTRAAVCVDDVTQDPDYLTTFASTRSEIVVPVVTTTTEPAGLIDVESERVAAFSDDDRGLIAACAIAIRPLWTT